MTVFLTIFSDWIIPLLILTIVVYAIFKKRPVYDDFVEGAAEGVRTVVKIMPTLVGLMVAVGILRGSGFLDFLGQQMSVLFGDNFIPPQAIPLSLVKMFSSSAATGLALDLFKEYGPDSFIGRFVSISMSCTETIFYTMSVYFLTAKVTKTGYTLAGALIATVAGLIASAYLAGI